MPNFMFQWFPRCRKFPRRAFQGVVFQYKTPFGYFANSTYFPKFDLELDFVMAGFKGDSHCGGAWLISPLAKKG